MTNNNLDHDIEKTSKENRVKQSIKKAPCYALKECLTFYTKDQLIEIAQEHGKDLSKSKKKGEMVEFLEEILLENITNDSLHITTLERKTIASLIKGNDIKENDFDITKNLKGLGYIYWFYHKSEFHAVCPIEIADSYMTSYEEDNEDIVRVDKPVELEKVESEPLYSNRNQDVIPIQEPFVLKTRKIGRNEKCPCGSGKKYKFCCIK